jgi:hypothetical protein
MNTYGQLGNIKNPSKIIRTSKRILQIDSMDRDISKYYTNGDFVIYLPRVYEDVVSLRLISATFPPLSVSEGITTAGARKHAYANGNNIQSTRYAQDVAINEHYYSFLLDIEGLNSMDETSVNSNKSGNPADSFGVIPVNPIRLANGNYYILYTDKLCADIESKFNPPLGKLDRLHIRTRTHDQSGNAGFIYWTRNGNPADGITPSNVLESSTSNTDINFTLTFEVEYIEHAFGN